MKSRTFYLLICNNLVLNYFYFLNVNFNIVDIVAKYTSQKYFQDYYFSVIKIYAFFTKFKMQFSVMKFNLKHEKKKNFLIDKKLFMPKFMNVKCTFL